MKTETLGSGTLNALNDTGRCNTWLCLHTHTTHTFPSLNGILFR